MKNIRLPEQITRTYFSCIEQQIMTLCYYYHNEFWKLFLEQKIVFERNVKENIEDMLKYENYLFKSAEKFYGIIFNNQNDLKKLTFEEKNIYLACIDVKYYPFTQYLEGDWLHCVLIYGDTEEGYIVNDNFYGEDSYIFDKKLYEQGIKQLFLVEYLEEKKHQKMIWSF